MVFITDLSKLRHGTSACLSKIKLWSVVFMLMVPVLVMANNELADIKVNVPHSNITFKELIKAIEGQTRYMIVYSQEEIDPTSKLNLTKGTTTLSQALDNACTVLDCSYSVDRNYITVKKNQITVQPVAATHEVSGIVTGDDGEPLIGVTVTGSNGAVTVTDTDGRYVIRLGQNDTARFSYIGYTPRVVNVGNRKAINVDMSTDVKALDEVVVVGYGTQKKVNLTGAVSTIKFGEEMGSRPVTSVSAALNGLAPGLAATQANGQPGSSATLRVRGTGTLNNSNPLVIVDGVEWSMDNLNPNDIESITLLKDAASTAIYGALGANGVILITTKKGDGQPKINYSGYFAVQKVINRLDYINNYADFMELANESITNIDQTPYYTQETIDLWRQAQADPYGVTELGVPNYIAYPNTDWFGTLFHTGHSQQHHLSVSGSSNKMNYVAAVGYLDNPGIMNQMGINSGEKKVTVQSRIEGKVNDWITVGANFYGTRQRKGVANVSGTFAMMSRTVPGIYPGERGKYGVPASIEESTTANNLLTYLDRSGKIDNTSATLQGYIIADIIKGLQIEGRYNYQLDRGDTHRWSNNYDVKYDYTRQTEINTPTLAEGSIVKSAAKTSRVNLDALLRYNVTIAGRHEISLLAGYSDSRYRFDTFSADKKGMTSWTLITPNSASTPQTISGSATEWSIESFFGRVNYAYMSRYLFEANVRRDGCSRFSPDSRWGTFPSFSLGWRVSEESFMNWSRDWLSNFKLRFSYGKIGNSRTDDYAWQALYQKKLVTLDGQSTNTLEQSKIGNNGLQWETTKTANYGLDLGFFNNRLRAEADFYVKNTSGILYTPAIYLTMGTVAGSTQNIAKVRNKGVELNLTWDDRIGNVQYSVGGNFAFNKSIVTKYKGALERRPMSNGEWINNIAEVSENGFGGKILEGHMLGETYINKIYRGTGNYACDGSIDFGAGPRDGIIRTERDMEWVKTMMSAGYKFRGVSRVGKNVLWYGDMIYADLDGDGDYGSINDAEMSGHSSLPKYNFGFNISARWNGFDFYALLSGAAGFHLLWSTPASPARGINVYKFLTDNRYFYDPENPSDPRTNIYSRYPRLQTQTGGASSDFWEYKGDYIKLKNVQIGYTLPHRITTKARIDKIRVYVSGDNLHTWTAFPGMDPEMGTSITYPLIRQFAFGLQVTL